MKVEPTVQAVTVTAMLSREHESIDQHLLVQAMVFAGTESDTGGPEYYSGNSTRAA